VRYPGAFYEDLAQAISSQQQQQQQQQEASASAVQPSSVAPKFLVQLATDSGHLVGAIVAAVMGLSSARSEGKLPCALLQGQAEDSLGVYVLLLAVWPRYRRLGVGSELMFLATAAAAGQEPRVKAAFLHARAKDAGAAAFHAANGFVALGRLPRYYTALSGKQPSSSADSSADSSGASPGGAEDAVLFVRPLRDAELMQFAVQAPAAGAGSGSAPALPDLSDPALKPVWKAPKWAMDLCLHFVLPISAVGLLFLLCYALVLLGPLKGISGLHLEEAPAPVPAPAATPVYLNAAAGGDAGQEL
jgi:ribosomal protein S18 acetylase RimI-like enzyme